MIYGVYEVTGSREYRGHAPGTRFEAVLQPAAEQRAIARGDIRLIERVTPSIKPGTFTLRKWPPPPSEIPPEPSHEAPEGASLIEGGG